MDKILKQNIQGKNTEYRIDDAGLKKIIHSKFGASEFHLPFEQIKTNKAFVFEQNKTALGVSILFLIISISVLILSFEGKASPEAFIVWLLVSIVSFVLYYKSREHKLYVETMDGKNLEFTISKSNHQRISDFVESLLNSRNKYLISKYATLNKNMEYQTQLENLNWLINNLVISKEQYDKKIHELNSLFHHSSGDKTIGFITSN